jgi:hypothetical protein
MTNTPEGQWRSWPVEELLAKPAARKAGSSREDHDDRTRAGDRVQRHLAGRVPVAIQVPRPDLEGREAELRYGVEHLTASLLPDQHLDGGCAALRSWCLGIELGVAVLETAS